MAEGYSPPKDLNAQNKKMVTHHHRRGRRAELPSADQLRAFHRIARAQSNKTYKIKEIVNTEILNKKIYSSKTAFDNLTRTVIPELKLEESATGKYIIVRIIEEGYSNIGYYTVVEDHEGNVCNLVIYNFPFEEIQSSIGYVLIIKEPYLKTSANHDTHIRCDCPSDILILRPCFRLYHLAREIEWKNKLKEGIVHDVLIGDSEPPVDPEQWVARGDQLVNEKQLVAAREAYRLGITCCETGDPNFKALRIKLLIIHLSLEWFEWTVSACDNILATFPDDPVTLYRLGDAYYSLRKYQTALEKCEKYCSLFPYVEMGQTLLVRVKDRIREENGEIDIEKLRRLSQEGPFDPIECADYRGGIEITKIPGKGRGLVLTKNVTKGSILIVSKALVFTYLRKNFEGPIEEAKKEEQLKLVSSLNVQKLTEVVYKNPNVFGPQVYDLFTGTYTKEPIQQFCNPEQKKEPICDVEKLRAIYQCNKFAIPERFINGEIFERGEGLFLIPSYLNHNCSPTVDIEFYNDVMVVRARKNLKVDAELTTSYVPLDMKFEKRSEMLKRRGINKCLCEKCKRKC